VKPGTEEFRIACRAEAARENWRAANEFRSKAISSSDLLQAQSHERVARLYEATNRILAMQGAFGAPK